MRHTSNIKSAAAHFEKIGDAIERVRFCRNVQATTEKDESENTRRLNQLFEAIDDLLKI